jgi:hypothetical protein
MSADLKGDVFDFDWCVTFQHAYLHLDGLDYFLGAYYFHIDISFFPFVTLEHDQV